jgi:hypothetical protein
MICGLDEVMVKTITTITAGVTTVNIYSSEPHTVDMPSGYTHNHTTVGMGLFLCPPPPNLWCKEYRLPEAYPTSRLVGPICNGWRPSVLGVLERPTLAVLIPGMLQIVKNLALPRRCLMLFCKGRCQHTNSNLLLRNTCSIWGFTWFWPIALYPFR